MSCHGNIEPPCFSQSIPQHSLGYPHFAFLCLLLLVQISPQIVYSMLHLPWIPENQRYGCSGTFLHFISIIRYIGIISLFIYKCISSFRRSLIIEATACGFEIKFLKNRFEIQFLENSKHNISFSYKYCYLAIVIISQILLFLKSDTA